MAAPRNFSQFPGFKEHFNKHPRQREAAAPAEQDLLHRHRPHIYLPPNHPGPVSFYDDYVSEGTLHGGDGAPISHAVTRAILNATRPTRASSSSTRRNAAAAYRSSSAAPITTP